MRGEVPKLLLPGAPPSDSGGEVEFTCEICMELTKGRLFRNGNRCSHPFCTDCMAEYIAYKLEDNVDLIICPAIGCHCALDPESFTGTALFLRWCDVLCDSAVFDLGRRCYCPYPNCSELILNECGDDRVKKTKCPRCKKWFCFECQMICHRDHECEENMNPDDAAFVRTANASRWMRCPRCKQFVELGEGCSVMRCRCGIDFCYNCGRRLHRHYCECRIKKDSPLRYLEMSPLPYRRLRNLAVLVVMSVSLVFIFLLISMIAIYRSLLRGNIC